MNSGHTLKLDLTRFSEELDTSGRRGSDCHNVTGEFKDDSKVFGLSNCRDGIAISQDSEDVRETGFGGKDQELSSGYMFMVPIGLSKILNRYLDVRIR